MTALTEGELLAIYAQLSTHPNPTPTTAHLAACVLAHIGTLPNLAPKETS